jgi:hypothetical protein
MIMIREENHGLARGCSHCPLRSLAIMHRRSPMRASDLIANTTGSQPYVLIAEPSDYPRSPLVQVHYGFPVPYISSLHLDLEPGGSQPRLANSRSYSKRRCRSLGEGSLTIWASIRSLTIHSLRGLSVWFICPSLCMSCIDNQLQIQFRHRTLRKALLGTRSTLRLSSRPQPLQEHSVYWSLRRGFRSRSLVRGECL